jgi:hypothetical protein
MTVKTSTSPLTPAMVDALKATGPEDVMAGGSTRTGLINRGMVHPKGSDRFGKLTETGLQARAKMLPAPAVEPAPETPAATMEPAPEDVAMISRVFDVPAEMIAPTEHTKAEPAAPAEDWREPAIRTRFHGKSLGERRQARRNQKAARRRTRAKNR